MSWYKKIKRGVRHPAYSIATSLIPNLDIANSLTGVIDKYTGMPVGSMGSDLLNSAIRTGLGYVQGGKSGALAGLAGGIAQNYDPVNTWIKNLSNYGEAGSLLENALMGGIKATGNAADPLYGMGMGALANLVNLAGGGSGSTAAGATPTAATGALGSIANFLSPATGTAYPTAATAPTGTSATGTTIPAGAVAGAIGATGAGTPTATAGGTTAANTGLLSNLVNMWNNLPTGAKLALGAGALGVAGSLSGSDQKNGLGSGFNPPDLWGQSTSSNTGSGYNYANYGGLGYPARVSSPPPISQRDYYTYGSRPEQLFFQDAPTVQSMPAVEVKTLPVPGKARGGALSSAVGYLRGGSNGRKDNVPIMASHGEYVMDAETMALLGDGNPEAGAKALDQWRTNLRKHKGQALAKGKFSPNAKSPEKYLRA